MSCKRQVSVSALIAAVIVAAELIPSTRCDSDVVVERLPEVAALKLTVRADDMIRPKSSRRDEVPVARVSDLEGVANSDTREAQTKAVPKSPSANPIIKMKPADDILGHRISHNQDRSPRPKRKRKRKHRFRPRKRAWTSNARSDDDADTFSSLTQMQDFEVRQNTFNAHSIDHDDRRYFFTTASTDSASPPPPPEPPMSTQPLSMVIEDTSKNHSFEAAVFDEDLRGRKGPKILSAIDPVKVSASLIVGARPDGQQSARRLDEDVRKFTYHLLKSTTPMSLDTNDALVEEGDVASYNSYSTAVEKPQVKRGSYSEQNDTFALLRADEQSDLDNANSVRRLSLQRHPYAQNDQMDKVSPLVTDRYDTPWRTNELFHPEQAPSLSDIFPESVLYNFQQLGGRFGEKLVIGGEQRRSERPLTPTTTTAAPRVTTYRPVSGVHELSSSNNERRRTFKGDSDVDDDLDDDFGNIVQDDGDDGDYGDDGDPYHFQRPVLLANPFATPPRPLSKVPLPGLRPRPHQFQPPFELPSPVEIHRRPLQRPGADVLRDVQRGAGKRRRLPHGNRGRRKPTKVLIEGGKDQDDPVSVNRSPNGYSVFTPGAFVQFEFRPEEDDDDVIAQQGLGVAQGYSRHNPFIRRQKVEPKVDLTGGLSTHSPNVIRLRRTTSAPRRPLVTTPYRYRLIESTTRVPSTPAKSLKNRATTPTTTVTTTSTTTTSTTTTTPIPTTTTPSSTPPPVEPFFPSYFTTPKEWQQRTSENFTTDKNQLHGSLVPLTSIEHDQVEDIIAVGRPYTVKASFSVGDKPYSSSGGVQVVSDIRDYDQLVSPAPTSEIVTFSPPVVRNSILAPLRPLRLPVKRRQSRPRPRLPSEVNAFSLGPIKATVVKQPKPTFGELRRLVQVSPRPPPRPTELPSLTTTISHLISKLALSNTRQRAAPRSDGRLRHNHLNDVAEQGSPQNEVLRVLEENGLAVLSSLLPDTDLLELLSSGKPFTLFAPTDRAFGEFLTEREAHLEGQSTDKQLEILLNHIVEGAVHSQDLENDLVGSAIGGGKLRSNIFYTENDDWKEIVVKTINGATLLQSDIQMPNGVVHVIDKVLYPVASGNIMHTLESDPEGRFTTFIKALKATKLARELSDYNTGPWTVFAPVNDAFMNLPMKELEDLIKDPKELRALVLNHLVNRTLYSRGLRSHQFVKMTGGSKLNIFRRRDRLKIEGANAVNMDIPAGNGVIQVIETLIDLPGRSSARV